MERRRLPPSPPSSRSNSSRSPSLLRDLSNYQTPLECPRSPSAFEPIPIFFTASKLNHTPSPLTSSCRNAKSGAARSKASRRLKELEVEQSRSARRVQVLRERELKSLANFLTVWLNSLLRNPGSCGCKVNFSVHGIGSVNPGCKRGSLNAGDVGRVEVGQRFRSPKRRRSCLEMEKRLGHASVVSSSKFAGVEQSLREVCSFEDVKTRLLGCMSEESCGEVISMMSQVCKNIDEGRLKMKANCPIVTDIRMKERATGCIMCYNPIWLRIGLHIIFGGDSLLPTAEDKHDQEEMLLKKIIEKQFFSHAEISKSYAYNKQVDGLYRPGYYENLGNIILKRFFLLVFSLDKAKCESSLPLDYGIDSIDGGSPLLFHRHSHIKSNEKLIQGFLCDAMHGEGDLLAHLTIIGCKVTHQQVSLSEYEFKISNLCEDLQDGIRLCRAIQLLRCDASVLSKLIAPSDTQKKKIHNCGVAIQYLRQAGVPVSDDHGFTFTPDDIATGEPELTLSVLWNVFAYLQVPLLIDKKSLSQEICQIKGGDLEILNCGVEDDSLLLLEWIRVVCGTYHCPVESFLSLVDGKAFCCLFHYYCSKHLKRCSSLKEDQKAYLQELSMLLESNDSVSSHNFSLVRASTSMFNNFPEVLQVSDIVDEDAAYHERCMIILLVFLAWNLIPEINWDNLVPSMFIPSYYWKFGIKHSNDSCAPYFLLSQNISSKNSRKRDAKSSSLMRKEMFNSYTMKVQAAGVIQSMFRGYSKRKEYKMFKSAVFLLQTVIRDWLSVSRRSENPSNDFIGLTPTGADDVDLKFLVERHSLGEINESVIQEAFQERSPGHHKKEVLDLVFAATILQSYIRRQLMIMRIVQTQNRASATIQLAWKRFASCRLLLKQNYSAIRIQRHWRGWHIRKIFIRQLEAVIDIQACVRSSICRRNFDKYADAAIQIQRVVRGNLARMKLTGVNESVIQEDLRLQTQLSHHKEEVLDLSFAATILQPYILGQLMKMRTVQTQNRPSATIQLAWKRFTSRRFLLQQNHSAIQIQRYWRGWHTRKIFICQFEAVINIQACVRSSICRRNFDNCVDSAIQIQRAVRGNLARMKLSDPNYSINGNALICASALEDLLHSVQKLQEWWRKILFIKSQRSSAIKIQAYARGWIARRAAKKYRSYISIIQTWWRKILCCRKLREKSAVIIQSSVRGWIARKAANMNQERVIVIQSYWKGYLVRKTSKQQISDLCCKLKRLATNVDDDMRLINRLVSAVSELLCYKSITSIRHTCATFNMATEHSQKCCATLVSAGAISVLLKQFYSLNRSIPDQEVLKHVLSTLRNISFYPQLRLELINTPHAVEIIFQELLRSKSEGFFVACEILKKMCEMQEGLEEISKMQAYVMRLKILSMDLERKAEIAKRNARRGNTNMVGVAAASRRSKAAACLLQCILQGSKG